MLQPYFRATTVQSLHPKWLLSWKMWRVAKPEVGSWPASSPTEPGFRWACQWGHKGHVSGLACWQQYIWLEVGIKFVQFQKNSFNQNSSFKQQLKKTESLFARLFDDHTTFNTKLISANQIKWKLMSGKCYTKICHNIDKKVSKFKTNYTPHFGR